MILLDIETTDVTANACVLSLGALAFNPNGTLAELKDAPKFHCHVELGHQIRLGRDYSLSTIRWLKGQPDAVRLNAAKSAVSRITLQEMVAKLSGWMNGLSDNPSNVHVRGMNFEGVILPNIEKQLGVRFPFNYSGYNDTRTLIRDYLDTDSSYVRDDALSEEAKEMIGMLTKHVAIDDCIIDAIQIIEARRIRNIRIYKEMHAKRDIIPGIKD